jgi:hypothetical protein
MLSRVVWKGEIIFLCLNFLFLGDNRDGFGDMGAIYDFLLHSRKQRNAKLRLMQSGKQ